MEEFEDVPGAVIVVQARLGARRLPGKVTLPLGSSTVLEQTLARIRASRLTAPILVAIPDLPSEQPLQDFCRARDIACVTGSGWDVMQRVTEAAGAAGADFVVLCDATGVLLEPRMLWASVRYAADSGMDYVTVSRLPLGTACEAMPLRTLQTARHLAEVPADREHPGAFIVSSPSEFECAFLPPPPRFARPDLRFALETEADYHFVSRIYSEMLPGHTGLLRLEDVIGYVDSDEALSRHGRGEYAVVRRAA